MEPVKRMATGSAWDRRP
jgi:hypothetical protein